MNLKLMSLLITVSFAISACNFKKKEIRDKEQAEVAGQLAVEQLKKEGKLNPKETVVLKEVTKTEVKDFAKITLANEPVQALDLPGLYKVTFKWGAEKGDYFYTASSSDNYLESNFTKNDSKSSRSDSVSDLYFIFNQPGVKTIRIEYFSKATGLSLDENYLKVEIPEDLVLSSSTEKSKIGQMVELHNFGTGDGVNNKFNRVFILKSFDWITNGYEVRIHANQSIKIARGAKISSFHKEERVSKNGRGKAAGNVFLNAPKIEGELIVDLRGQDGASGGSGNPWMERAAAGANGKSAESRLTKGEAICANPDGPCRGSTSPVAICVTQPTNGSPGKDGAVGDSGKDGYDGGKGGVIEVLSSDPTELLLKFAVSGGIGGSGGEGANGQRGGIGGAPGGRDQHNVCNQAIAGPDGANGPKGPYGKPGKKGDSGYIESKSALKPLTEEIKF